MAATYEELMAKARELDAAGDRDGATRLAKIAVSRREGPTKAAANDFSNADGTFGTPPAEMVKSPNTGGYMDVALPHNRIYGEGAASAALQGAGQGVTFGAMDEMLGAMNGAIGPNSYQEDYEFGRDRVRTELDLAREEHPIAAIGGEIGGALLVPGAAMKAAHKGTTGLRALKGAGIGAAQGGLYGFNAGEGGFEGRGKNALLTGALGGGLGGSAPVAGKLLGRILEKRSAAKATKEMLARAPSAAEDRAAGNALYKMIDDANVQIKPEAFSRTRKEILEALRGNTGFDELPGPGSLTPNSARVMQIMKEAGEEMAGEPTAALPFKSLDQMRRQAGSAAGNVTNKTDQKAGMEIIGGLDDFVQKAGPDDVVAGDLSTVQKLLPEARETWSRMLKTQGIEDAIEAGQNYLSGQSSGVRNQIAKLLRNPKIAKNYNAAELEAMRRIVDGSGPERLVNLAGGGLGQLSQMGIGFGTGGPLGATFGAATAAGSRKLSEKITLKNAEAARALIASGGKPVAPQIDHAKRMLIENLMRRTARPATAVGQR